MSAFTGKQGNGKQGSKNTGAMRLRRAKKREEAETRNAVTAPERRRASRRGRIA